MKIGYARVSTGEQNLDMQTDALTAAGCEKIFHDTLSGGRADRAGLEQLLEFAREDDCVVVWRLDRLGRSLSNLIEVVTALAERKIHFQSLSEQIDTTSSAGKLVFHIFGAIAEFERNLIRERTVAGLEAARKRGRKGGRPRKLDKQQIKEIKVLRKSPDFTVQEICEIYKISRATLYRIE